MHSFTEDGDIGRDLYHHICDFLTSNNKKCNKKHKTKHWLERHIKHNHTQVQEIKSRDMEVFLMTMEGHKPVSVLTDKLLGGTYSSTSISNRQIWLQR